MSRRKILLILIFVMIIIGGLLFLFSDASDVSLKGDIDQYNFNYSYVLTNNIGEAMAGEEIIVTEYLNDEVIRNSTLITDDNGRISGNLTNTDSGNHTLMLRFDGGFSYADVYTNSTFEILEEY